MPNHTHHLPQPTASSVASPADGRAESLVRAIRWFLLAVVLCATGIEFWSRDKAYHDQLDQSRIAGQNVAEAAIEHADLTLNAVSWMLDGVTERVAADGVTGPAGVRLHAFPPTDYLPNKRFILFIHFKRKSRDAARAPPYEFTNRLLLAEPGRSV